MADIPDDEDLPEDAVIIFHVAGTKTRPSPRADGAPCEEIDAAALRCDADGISVTCLNLFEGEDGERLRHAVAATASNITVRKSGWFAKIRVGDLLEAVSEEEAMVRVIRDPLPGNPGHCLITGITDDDIGLKMVAAEAFREFLPATDFPESLAKK